MLIVQIFESFLNWKLEFSLDHIGRDRCEMAHPMDEVVLRKRDHNESFYRCLVCGSGIRMDGPYYESTKFG